MTAERKFRSSWEIGTSRGQVGPQALLGAVSSPAAAPTPSRTNKAHVHYCVCDQPDQHIQPTSRSIPGKQRAPRHFAPALGGSGGAPTQVHPPHSPKEVTKLSLTKPAQLLAQCSAPPALHPAQSLCSFHTGQLQIVPTEKKTQSGGQEKNHCACFMCNHCIGSHALQAATAEPAVHKTQTTDKALWPYLCKSALAAAAAAQPGNKPR